MQTLYHPLRFPNALNRLCLCGYFWLLIEPEIAADNQFVVGVQTLVWARLTWATITVLMIQAFLTWRKTPVSEHAFDVWTHRLQPEGLATVLIASICLGILSWRYRPFTALSF
jgi:hypothetical protein